MTRLAVLFVLVCFNLAAQQKTTSDACNDKAQSQADLTRCADEELKRVDGELNQTYQQLLKKIAKNTVATAKLRNAQRAWLAFRDAQVDSMFPSNDKTQYGSVYPMCILSIRSSLTSDRVKALKQMLNPTEGDVCAAGLSQ